MKIPVRVWSDLEESERARILSRAELDIDGIVADVQPIVAAVATRRDEALREYTHRLDHLPLELPFEVPAEEFDHAERRLDPTVREALDYAIANVTAAHEHQRSRAIELTEVRPGLLAGERTRPIDSVGLYVPQGRGRFPSMLYMLAVPARLAGVPRITVATPPSAQGAVDDACLYAARKCGVHAVYRMGGAQAIAAFAYGTESVPRVDKIVGPGSAYVAAAKRLLRDRVDVGLPAGPSESVVLADATARAQGVSVDLLIEAEHGSDSQAILVTTSSSLAGEVADLLPHLIDDTPEPRRTYLRDVFSGYGGIVLAGSMTEAAHIVNEIAPEHLQIRTAEPWSTMSLITSAAEILLGEHSAFSLANYAAGANAVLPTGGAARTWSGVSVHDFVKRTSVVQVSSDAYGQIASHVQALAEYEGFHWHARALRER